MQYQYQGLKVEFCNYLGHCGTSSDILNTGKTALTQLSNRQYVVPMIWVLINTFFMFSIPRMVRRLCLSLLF